MPAKQAPRCMAPATPVFAGAPAPTGTAPTLNTALSLWERVYPQSRHCGVWHRLRRCSRARPLPQVLHQP